MTRPLTPEERRANVEALQADTRRRLAEQQPTRLERAAAGVNRLDGHVARIARRAFGWSLLASVASGLLLLVPFVGFLALLPLVLSIVVLGVSAVAWMSTGIGSAGGGGIDASGGFDGGGGE